MTSRHDTTPQPEQPEAPQGFELNLRIPAVGELDLQIYPETWRKLVEMVRQPVNWFLVLLLLGSGTVGLNLVRLSELLHQLPSGEISQPKR